MMRAGPTLLSCVLLAGCTGGDPPDAAPARIDADAPLDAAPPADAAPACNSLDLAGVGQVTSTSVKDPPPEFTGGSIADGTYILTGMTYYNGGGGPSADRVKMKIRITGRTFEAVTLDLSLASPIVNTTSALVPSGAGMCDLTRTCPTDAFFICRYSATPTSLTLEGPYYQVLVFTRQ